MIENNEVISRKGISGSTLKLIAIVTMLIDHVGAVVLIRMMLQGVSVSGAVDEKLWSIYELSRDIGRVAFPIFCFLLVEGFERTRDRGKYALRLGIFALISEIPFNLAVTGRVFDYGYQNVYFTLLIGLVTMMAVNWIGNLKNPDYSGKILETMLAGLGVLLSIGTVALGAWAAEALHTDYGALGILCIMVLYLFRSNRKLQAFAGACTFLWETTAPLAFIPVWWYNGTRGMKLKYVFYLFYPIHLLVLYGICVMMGIHGYSPV